MVPNGSQERAFCQKGLKPLPGVFSFGIPERFRTVPGSALPLNTALSEVIFCSKPQETVPVMFFIDSRTVPGSVFSSFGRVVLLKSTRGPVLFFLDSQRFPVVFFFEEALSEVFLCERTILKHFPECFFWIPEWFPGALSRVTEVLFCKKH